MLVLTRNIGEKIFIGDDIVIQVCDIRGDQVRIGVDAPRDVLILREEVMPKGPGRIRSRRRPDSP